MRKEHFLTASAEETFTLGKTYGQGLPRTRTVAFSGGLGAGKTTFIRGLVAGAAQLDGREVCSPTFAYLNIYEGSTTIYHFDLYRIPSEQEFIAAGFDEFLHLNGICCIEWSERISSLLPEAIDRITIEALGQECRQITIETNP